MFSSRKRKGFTVVELVVSIAIFAVMTALLISKYARFNDSVLLTNLAYDIALIIRGAQTYGMSVQGTGSGVVSSFQYPYGVVFCSRAANCPGPTAITVSNTEIVLFADTNAEGSQGAYDTNDLPITKYKLKNGVKIVGFCRTEDDASCTGANGTQATLYRADISFKRPFPTAIICPGTTASGVGKQCSGKGISLAWGSYFMKIVIQGPSGELRNIRVNDTGQITVY